MQAAKAFLHARVAFAFLPGSRQKGEMPVAESRQTEVIVNSSLSLFILFYSLSFLLIGLRKPYHPPDSRARDRSKFQDVGVTMLVLLFMRRASGDVACTRQSVTCGSRSHSPRRDGAKAAALNSAVPPTTCAVSVSTWISGLEGVLVKWLSPNGISNTCRTEVWMSSFSFSSRMLILLCLRGCNPYHSFASLCCRLQLVR